MGTNADRVILGIDPGTTILGYGVIAIKGNSISLVTIGILHLSKLGDHHLKLQRIFSRVVELTESYLPDEVAIEAPFFGKNVQSMLKLGRAQGVAIAAALHKQIPVVEYAPKKIKQSITGNGNASKEQVAAMLQQLLHFEEMPKHLDATDGLAAAVCHYFQTGQAILRGGINKVAVKRKKKSDWGSFIKDNPGKLLT